MSADDQGVAIECSVHDVYYRAGEQCYVCGLVMEVDRLRVLLRRIRAQAQGYVDGAIATYVCEKVLDITDELEETECHSKD